MSAFNAAMAYNLRNTLTGIYPGYTINYEKAIVSRDSLPGALNPGVTSLVAGKVDYSWDDNSQDTDTRIDDKAVLVIYNPLRNHAVTVIGGSTRESGMHSITFPDFFSGESVECYISFTDANESVVSDSQWVARITVA